VEVRGSRLLVELEDPSSLSATDLDRLGTRGWVIVSGGIQIIIGPGVEAAAEALSLTLDRA
jgi:phosphotransferase system IIB component